MGLEVRELEGGAKSALLTDHHYVVFLHPSPSSSLSFSLSAVTDSCKFLHDRSDYKSGWQLDREFEENSYNQEGEQSSHVRVT